MVRKWLQCAIAAELDTLRRRTVTGRRRWSIGWDAARHIHAWAQPGRRTPLALSDDPILNNVNFLVRRRTARAPRELLALHTTFTNRDVRSA